MAVESYTPQEVSSMMNLIDTFLRWRTASTRNDRSYDHYHPSEFGKCLRQQQYKHYAWKGLIEVKHDTIDSEKQRLFDKGHNMHARWANYFDQIGNVLLGRWMCKNPLCLMADKEGKYKVILKDSAAKKMREGKARIYGQDGPIFRPKKCVCGCSDFEYLETAVEDLDINMKGHADLLINCENLKEERFKGVRISYNHKFLPTKNNKIVIDMKTCGSNAWKNQIMAKGPHNDYLVQLTIYVHILGCDYGIVAYENKDNSKMKWFIVPRNDEWWEIVRYQASAMMEMAKSNKLPPPKYDKKTYSCKWCEFRDLCHKSKIWESPTLEKKKREFYKSLL